MSYLGGSSAPSIHDLERIAKAGLDASRKNLWDCLEREHEAFTAYLEAMAATLDAHDREQGALYAWNGAARKLTADAKIEEETTP